VVARYHVTDVIGSNVAGEIVQALDELAREGARQMLEKALKDEVAEHLGRDPWERSDDFRGHRNGYGRKRTVAIGTWAVPVRQPRVSDEPEGTLKFKSNVLPPRTRMSMETQRLFARLYLEGLSTGDFEPVFRQLLGETAPLSPNTIIRLKEEWQDEYKAWKARSLKDEFFVYVWMDGIYIGAGLEDEKSCLLTLVGARSDGTKELIAMELGYRESEASWGEVFRSLRDRGMRSPVLFIGDGNLGAWKGLGEVFPTARQQRCLNHRATNVQDKLPKRMQGEAGKKLSELYAAPTKSEAERVRDELVEWLRRERQVPAADTVLRDWEHFVTFYDFPADHWIHLKTTNPIESVFAGVRIRTDAAKRMRQRDNALYLVYKIVRRLSFSWRALNGGPNLMAMVVAGEVFKDGVLQASESDVEVMTA
jgi:putative transposase